MIIEPQSLIFLIVAPIVVIVIAGVVTKMIVLFAIRLIISIVALLVRMITYPFVALTKMVFQH